jgi:hypothetical protein
MPSSFGPLKRLEPRRAAFQEWCTRPFAERAALLREVGVCAALRINGKPLMSAGPCLRPAATIA